jgi:hypothetical protein
VRVLSGIRCIREPTTDGVDVENGKAITEQRAEGGKSWRERRERAGRG